MLPHTGMMLALEEADDDWSDSIPGRQADALFDELDLPRTGQFESLDDDDYRQKRPQKKNKSGKAPRLGRRRGGSKDRRQWFVVVVVLVLAAGAIAGVLKFAFPSHGGPAHNLVTPRTVGAYTLTPSLAKQMNVGELVDHVRKMSGGQATHLVSGVYQSGSVAPGGTDAQIFMFIGGHLANADPASSINSFIAKFSGARPATAGAMGGKAACVEDSAGADGKVAMCIWFDNDSFGELVSPTMTTATLQNVLLSVRPSLEVVAER